jgi:multiple sugar transport system ATP-binding protein
MNFIEGTLSTAGGAPVVVSSEGGLKLPLAKATSGKEGQAVIYGIRPEHLDLTDSGRGLSAEVVVVEPTGAEILVFARMAGQEVSVVFKERHQFHPGDKINLTPHTGTVHLFDKASGQRVDT